MNSYELAVKQAKEISPWAKVRLAEDGLAWQITIPTGILSPFRLPDSYRGTPAWDAYNEPNIAFQNALMSWANRKKMLGRPLEYIADYYNLSQTEGAEMAVFAKELHKETGVADLDWPGEVTNEQFSQYEDNMNKAAAMVDQTNRKALDEKWENLSY